MAELIKLFKNGAQVDLNAETVKVENPGGGASQSTAIVIEPTAADVGKVLKAKQNTTDPVTYGTEWNNEYIKNIAIAAGTGLKLTAGDNIVTQCHIMSENAATFNSSCINVSPSASSNKLTYLIGMSYDEDTLALTPDGSGAKLKVKDNTFLPKTMSTFQTTAPTAAITDGGVHIVHLASSTGVTEYNGYIYMYDEA